MSINFINQFYIRDYEYHFLAAGRIRVLYLKFSLSVKMLILDESCSEAAKKMLQNYTKALRVVRPLTALKGWGVNNI